TGIPSSTASRPPTNGRSTSAWQRVWQSARRAISAFVAWASPRPTCPADTSCEVAGSRKCYGDEFGRLDGSRGHTRRGGILRRLILQTGISIDGYVAALDNSHPWGVAREDEGVKRWILDSVWAAGAHLMGRVTYEEMAAV